MSDLATGAPDTNFATPVNSRRLALGDTAAATHGSLPPPFLLGGELLGTKTRTLSTAMMVRDAGGIANEPTWLSMAIPCSMNVEDICPLTAKKITKDAQVGNIRSRIFSSSTCVTVQSDHELMGLLHMALPNSCNNHLTEALEGAKSQVPKPVNS
uniref:Uncharacterized protein n=1 Tax=Oryza nivara TaxID=4536 RepID=A0A0E0INZ9_ORYNI